MHEQLFRFTIEFLGFFYLKEVVVDEILVFFGQWLALEVIIMDHVHYLNLIFYIKP